MKNILITILALSAAPAAVAQGGVCKTAWVYKTVNCGGSVLDQTGMRTIDQITRKLETDQPDADGKGQELCKGFADNFNANPNNIAKRERLDHPRSRKVYKGERNLVKVYDFHCDYDHNLYPVTTDKLQMVQKNPTCDDSKWEMTPATGPKPTKPQVRCLTCDSEMTSYPAARACISENIAKIFNNPGNVYNPQGSLANIERSDIDAMLVNVNFLLRRDQGLPPAQGIILEGFQTKHAR